MNQSTKELRQPKQEANSEQTADNISVSPSTANAMLGAVKRKVSFTVPHCEDWKPVVAKGFIEGDYFTGEYRLKGMTYGCTIKVPFKSFLIEKPNDKVPLIVRFEDGSVDHAYYVGYTNMLYPRSLYHRPVAKEWCYR